MKKIRVGIVGTGIIARAHAEGIAVCELSELTAICDIDECQMDYFEKEMRIQHVKRYTDYRKMILSGMIDAVLVCTPTVSHCEISVFAASCGIHVFCEKPLAMNGKEADMMAEAARKNHVISMTGFAFRYIPAVAFIKSLADSGKLGKIRHYRGHFYANRLAPANHPLEWRHLEDVAGSGVTGDLICHVLDMGRYITGESYANIDKMMAFGNIIIPERFDEKSKKMIQVTAEETMTACLHFEDGMEMNLQGTRYSPFEMGFEVSGTKGSIKYNMMRYNEVEILFYETEGVYSQKNSQFYERKIIPDSFAVKDKIKEGRFVRQHQVFAEAICKNETLEADFAEGAANQAVLDNIQKAYKFQMFNL